jgi:hypothetical protein
MIKKALKKTLAYKIYFKARQKFNIFYNSNFKKFKQDKKYKEQSLSTIFKNIYDNKEWGDANLLGLANTQNLYFSGTGSYTNASKKYVRFIVDFLKKNNIKSVVDLGCGDFNIGKQITDELSDLKYIGVDIFQEIIDFNNLNYCNKNITFLCVNTIKNVVPVGDVLLIREVFQHLSNSSIKQIINLQFNLFENILITECLPPKDYITSYNLDKPDGPGYRVDHGSGVFLDQPPFSLNITEVFSTNHEYFGEIKTFKINKNML